MTLITVTNGSADVSVRERHRNSWQVSLLMKIRLLQFSPLPWQSSEPTADQFLVIASSEMAKFTIYGLVKQGYFGYILLGNQPFIFLNPGL